MNLHRAGWRVESRLVRAERRLYWRQRRNPRQRGGDAQVFSREDLLLGLCALGVLCLSGIALVLVVVLANGIALLQGGHP